MLLNNEVQIIEFVTTYLVKFPKLHLSFPKFPKFGSRIYNPQNHIHGKIFWVIYQI
jgi:hypothetical protein